MIESEYFIKRQEIFNKRHPVWIKRLLLHISPKLYRNIHSANHAARNLHEIEEIIRTSKFLKPGYRIVSSCNSLSIVSTKGVKHIEFTITEQI